MGWIQATFYKERGRKMSFDCLNMLCRGLWGLHGLLPCRMEAAVRKTNGQRLRGKDSGI